ncbi:MAG: hypothetical protein LC776_19780, partial [Acidobacteria bacterium]|nr:hypothetical protein [Acidobacteriota bacterium]
MTDLASHFTGVGEFVRAWRFFGLPRGARSATSAISAREVLPVSSALAPDIIPAWAANLQRRVSELALRPEGWDSYGARALQREALAGFYDVLGTLAHAVQSEPLIS